MADIDHHPSVQEVLIAVIGPDANAWPKFCTLNSGSSYRHKEYPFAMPTRTFWREGRKVVLIETPPLEEYITSVDDILGSIQELFYTRYKNSCMLDGFILLTGNWDEKPEQTETQYLSMLRKHYGSLMRLENVMIVASPRHASREHSIHETRRRARLHNIVLDAGGMMAVYERGSPTSMRHILSIILGSIPFREDGSRA
ncbi:hypothetical protein K474DRAFT_48269 [Panus rudis PR-1116 ss-1]|nr:hypothetical protein K474DRAFT_48269 [Panus rudis PR-1116 ss-1]